MRWFLLLSGIILCVCFTAVAQVSPYTPVGGLPSTGRLGVLRAAAAGCTTPPTLPEIQDQLFRGWVSVMSTGYAVQLGITFAGSGSGNYAQDDIVIVSDLQRGKKCLATDGHTELLYGQALRSTVRTSKIELKPSMSLAIVAASATINNRQNYVEVQTLGLPAPVQALMLAAQNLASSGLTVENYGKFMDKITEAKTEALKPVGSVVLIGIVDDITDNDLIASVTRAFALSYIGRGRTCSDTIEAYKRSGADQQQIIRNTYTSVAKGCDAPSHAVQQKAQDLLNGVAIRQE